MKDSIAETQRAIDKAIAKYFNEATMADFLTIMSNAKKWHLLIKEHNTLVALDEQRATSFCKKFEEIAEMKIPATLLRALTAPDLKE